MAEDIVKIKVSQLPQVGNINNFEVLGVDKSTNQSARATMTQLRGNTGDKGETGATGPANKLTIGTVQSGTTPSATITGTAPNQTLNLILQKGDKGDKGEKGDKGDALKYSDLTEENKDDLRAPIIQELSNNWTKEW